MMTRQTRHIGRLLWCLIAATLAGPVAAEAQSDTVVYYYTDAVGTVGMTTDGSGTVLARYDDPPFGAPSAAPPPPVEPRRFAGKERDAETGLDYFGARYYSNQIGRFATVDPAIEIERSLVNPQNWNRYSYALNNPLKFTDPDGRSATLVGGLVGGAIGGGIALLQGASWREIGAAAAGGALSGAMLGSVVDTGGASLPVLLGAGALAGIESRIVENAINGRGTTARDIALSGVAGTAGVAAGEVMLAGAQAMTRAGVRAGLTSVGELQATHGMTMSGREFARLKADIAKNGIQDPIKYVEMNGQKMVVDGHHRLQAAQALGMRNVPTQRVTLPYAGYRTPEDLVNWDR